MKTIRAPVALQAATKLAIAFGQASRQTIPEYSKPIAATICPAPRAALIIASRSSASQAANDALFGKSGGARRCATISSRPAEDSRPAIARPTGP